jgi:hypothetical protein
VAAGSRPELDDDLAPEASEAGAVFAPTRLRGSGKRRLLAAIALLAVAGLIGVGALERQAPDETAVLRASSDGPGQSPEVEAALSSRPTPSATLAKPVPIPTERRAVIAIDIRPAGSHLFVHGDVFSLSVARVTVTLEDRAGHVAATAAVDVPGGSTAFRLGAVQRFDVHFDLADEVQTDGFVVATTALDSAGKWLDTVVDVIPRSPDQM